MVAFAAGFGLSDTSAQPAAAVAGMPVSKNFDDTVSAQWIGGTTTDVWTLTIGSAAAQDYGFDAVTPDGASFSPRFTRAGSETTAQIAVAVAAAANALPGLTAWATIAASGSTVVITARLAGTAGAIAVTEALANQTLANTTAAADGQDLPFGRIVALSGYSGSTLQCKPLGDVLSAQSATVTVVYEAAKDYVVTLDGTSVTVAADTDAATTAGNIVTALGAIALTDVTITDNSDGTFDVAADKVGVEFTLSVGIIDGSTGSISITAGSGTPTGQTSIALAILGASLLGAEARKPMDDGAPVWQDGQDAPIQIGVQSAVWVPVSGSYTLGAPLFVDISGGANDGALFATTGASRIALPATKYQPQRASGSLVLIRRLAT